MTFQVRRWKMFFSSSKKYELVIEVFFPGNLLMSVFLEELKIPLWFLRFVWVVLGTFLGPVKAFFH